MKQFGSFLGLFLLLAHFSLFSQDQIDSIHTEDSIISIAKIQDKNIGHLPIDKGIELNVKSKQSGILHLSVNGNDKEIVIDNGHGVITDLDEGLHFIEWPDSSQSLYHASKGKTKNIPLWLSLVPPLVAIILALLFKEVIVSLFIGILSGVLIIGGLQWTSFSFYISSLLRSVDTFIVNALADTGHLSVILFSLLIGGMVAIISKNGGMMGIVNILSRFAKGPKSTQLITWLLGILIFFDDYANTLIVGNTMRSVSDTFRISREKLAYIVDSTAAPVAAVAFVTTWIGAELGYIGDAIITIPELSNYTPYALFLKSLKYSFYPILTLIFIFMLIRQGRDYGPMLKAELRARTTGQVSPASSKADDEPDMEDLNPVKNAKMIWWHAALPIFLVILCTIIGLCSTGFASTADSLNLDHNGWASIWGAMDGSFFQKLGNVIGAGDSYAALIWASFIGVLTSIFITVFTKTMKLHDTMHWMVTGFKTMLPAIIILVLAWALASTTEALHTADFLSKALSGNIHAYVLPILIFVLAAFISFSTGSSWSTMAILYPIAIPTSYAVCQASGLPADQGLEIILCVIATVLGASVLGDHCSPISDTTILSSLATDCNHIDHVRTQLPYALTVGFVSIVAMTVAIILGGGFLICVIMLSLSVICMWFIIRILGKDLPQEKGI